MVHLVRHAEVHNPGGVLYGRAHGFPLTERGEAMAELLVDFFRGRDVAAVSTSPMQRARQTAAPLAAHLELPVELDDRLIEASSRLEGRRVSLSRPVWRQPQVWASLWNPWRPSWGEPYREVASRMWAAVDEARRAAQGREVVLVSHQMPIWVLRRGAEGRRLAHDPRRRECSLASVTSLHFDGDRVVRTGYAEPNRTRRDRG